MQSAPYLASSKAFSVLSVNCSGIRSRFILRHISPWFPIKTVTEASSGPEALLEYETLRPDLVLTCQSLAGFTGIDLARAIRSRTTPTKIVMASTQEYCIQEALEAGVNEFVLLPPSPGELENAVRRPFGLEPIRGEIPKVASPAEDVDALIEPLDRLLKAKFQLPATLSVTQTDHEIVLHIFRDVDDAQTEVDFNSLLDYASWIPILIPPVCGLILSKPYSFKPGFSLRLHVTVETAPALNMERFSWFLADIYSHRRDFLEGRMETIMS
jgi:CheY-like chemotaxis protein